MSAAILEEVSDCVIGVEFSVLCVCECECECTNQRQLEAVIITEQLLRSALIRHVSGRRLLH